mmetsp:Transcript_16689/g.42813  ORF Transcript_16689/g.42813 Transcript_16689/m.42813 type:complete len:202 (-) Transcript_16689:360-965(-)
MPGGRQHLVEGLHRHHALHSADASLRHAVVWRLDLRQMSIRGDVPRARQVFRHRVGRQHVMPLGELVALDGGSQRAEVAALLQQADFDDFHLPQTAAPGSLLLLILICALKLLPIHALRPEAAVVQHLGLGPGPLGRRFGAAVQGVAVRGDHVGVARGAADGRLHADHAQVPLLDFHLADLQCGLRGAPHRTVHVAECAAA